MKLFAKLHVPILALLGLITVRAGSQPLNFYHFTAENGLSDNSIISIAQDADGFMWYGTQSNGLNKYDGAGFKTYANVPGKEHSLSGNAINALLLASDGTLWIGTSKGLNKYNRDRDDFDRMPAGCLSDSTIYCIYEDSRKRIWVGTKWGLNLLTDPGKNSFRTFFSSDSAAGGAKSIHSLFEDSRNRLWVGTQNGLIRIPDINNPSRFEEFYQHPADPNSLSGNYITTIAEDQQHSLWFGTHDNGLNRFNEAGNAFIRYSKDKNEMADNSVRKLLLDKKGKLWVGTQDGLSMLSADRSAFVSHKHDPLQSNSISQNSVHSLFQDDEGSLWIGTYFGGVNVVYAYNTPFQAYRNAVPGKGISNNVVSSIVEDERSNLWIGTEGGGLNYFDRSSGQFTVFKNRPSDASSISSNLIKKVYRDRKRNLWIGTAYNKGLDLLEPGAKRFIHIPLPRRDLSGYDEIADISEDHKGNIWVAAQSGLYFVRKAVSANTWMLELVPYPMIRNRNVHSLFEDSKQNMLIGTSAGLYLVRGKDGSVQQAGTGHDSLSLVNVNGISEDDAGNIWIATRNTGLVQWERPAGRFVYFGEEQGLVSTAISSVIQDKAGDLWVSTDNGLYKKEKNSSRFIRYNHFDGLPGNKFNTNSCFRDRAGTIYFGTYSGLVHFNPSEIEVNQNAGRLQFTSLEVYGKPVSKSGGNEDLFKALKQGERLVFEYDQNFFTIRFSLLNFIKPEKNRYAYRLSGYDTDWQYTTSGMATYTRLPAGDYTFQVRAANNDGVWTDTAKEIRVTITPPLWKTWWAYGLYLLLLLLVIFLIARFLYIKAVFRREYELQQFKLNFFTGISHEIRTHLTLILSPVDRLMEINKGQDVQERMLGHIRSNATRLLELVTELMDFRRAETNNLTLQVTRENLALFLEDMIHSFREIAGNRQITCRISVPTPPEVYFDKTQMKKIFFNLLSNAVKFTGDDGRIDINVTANEKEIFIQVKDNGRGIPPEDLKMIFESYFQGKEAGLKNIGYGIGLALSKLLTELHHGKMTVESSIPSGEAEGFTCFTVALLKGAGHFTAEQLKEPQLSAFQETLFVDHLTPSEEVPASSGLKPVILVVEDNAELRAFIVDALSSTYSILEAEDGPQALIAATEQIPDLVISDVMMPGTDGFGLCRQLKTDPRTSHIPVILLTAKSAYKDQVDGFDSGAELYITKPFSLNLLNLQVRNLLAARNAMRQKYSRQVMLEPQNIPITNTDEQFLQQMILLIEQNMDNPELGVSLLTEQMAMSKPVLYKKLKALTGMSVHELIISLRLKKAARLLEQKKLTVAEVAYAVGYSDRKYFSKEFKKLFGRSPSEFLIE